MGQGGFVGCMLVAMGVLLLGAAVLRLRVCFTKRERDLADFGFYVDGFSVRSVGEPGVYV